MDSDIRKLQMVILDMTKEIHTLCQENGIPYSLNGGSLLGAVRHQGFIPWDDDLDMCMLREDYERFLKLCKEQLDQEKYYIQTPEIDKNYGFAFAKIRLNGTKIIEDFSKNVPIHNGIFVDIFPYDNLPEGRFIRKVFMLRNHYYKNLDWVKSGYGTGEHKRKVGYKLMHFLASFYSLEKIKSKRRKLIQKYNDEKSSMVFISDYPTECIPIAWMRDLKEFQFENQKFYGMKQAEKYLAFTYGEDYMELPPPEKRIQHSSYEIDYGNYR